MHQCPSATERGFSAPLWLTYKQAQELGAQVRKGEKGSLVVYANTISRTETDEATGEDMEREIPFMKGYTVFNADQVDGLPAHFYAMQQPSLDPVARIAKAEAFFARRSRHQGRRRSGLLQPGRRPCADAAVCGLP